MATDPFRIMEAAFEEASTLSADERAVFLDQFNQEHPELVGELRRLLDADRVSEQTFSDPIEASIKATAQDREDHWLGRHLGVWKLSRRLGAGGMGAVFLASRTGDDFQQTAAVKIMGSQLLNADASSRFRAERQILSNLNHPNIASLIDGGTTEDGLPYLVMEYVDGDRVDAYCDKLCLTVRERLELFTKVCGAIDYAHRNLVVHRDLKPSNILVNDNGEPKLLDFGIAKLLDPDPLETMAIQTGKNARMMTPEYASPEQVRGEPVSIASDVYALGVLLFRLLTGHSPYDGSLTTQREIESAILESDPKRPSEAVSLTQSNEASLRIGRRKDGLPVEQLRRRLAGDLDNIVLKCLQKDPERRYANARELIADMDRYLSDRPVLARGDSWTYKAKKYFQRNWRPLAIGAATTTTIISLITYYTVLLADERDRAQLAAAEAEQVSDFLGAMFSSASPAVTQGNDVTILEIIDAARKNIEALEGQEKLQGNLFFIMGESYYWLGQDEEAIELYAQSLAKFEKLPTKPIPEIIESLIALGDTQARFGDFDKSISTLETARDLAADEFGVSSSKAIWADTLIATNLSRQRRYDEALPIFEAALDRYSETSDKDDDLELFLLAGFANTLDDTGRNDESIPIRKRVVERSELVKGELHPVTIVRIHNLALGMRRQWRLEEARGQMKTAIFRGATTWERDNPTRRNHLGSYAINLQLLGEFDEAKPYLEEARDLALEIDGADSGSYVQALLQLAIWNKERGNLETAVTQFDDVIPRSIEVYGDRSFITNVCRLYLAQTLNEMAEFDRSLSVSNKAMEDLEILTESLSVTLNMQHARALLANGQPEQASQIVGELVSLRDGDGEQSGPQAVSIFTDFANFYRNAGALDLAERYAKRAHDNGQQELPKGNWYAALATAEYAYALAALGKSADATTVASIAHDDLTAAFGSNDYRVIALKELIGQ